MPLRDFSCVACGKDQERYYRSAEDTPTCACGGSLNMLERSDEGARRMKTYGIAAFPFTTRHIDALGRPMQIESLSHLRQVERQYGVTLSAFSQNPSNPDAIPDPPRYRGDEWKHLDPRARFR